MGRYYALHDGEPKEVADAIEQHYRPRFAGDRLPDGPMACSAALADKVETIIGIFGIELIPSGDRDPFALRRHALGVLRILCEQQLRLDLSGLLKSGHDAFPKGMLLESHKRGNISVPNYIEAGGFVRERAKSYLRDMGYSVLEVEAVLDLDPMPIEYVSRLEAARAFLTLPEAAGLAEADKRIRNILTKSGGASVVQLTDESQLQVDTEKQLLRTTRLLRSQVDELLKQEKFKDALLLTAQIHQPVTTFFEKVMVNVEDQAIRTNRFALLHEVVNLTNRVANISKLAA
jgi:glycyl-tRNA synthetase beta chain